MVARGEERLRAVAERIREQAPERRIEIATVDVQDGERLAAHALEIFGRVDTLVNNAFDAGLDEGLNVLDVSDETWERVFAINLFAPLRLIRALAPTLGNVINLVSGSGPAAQQRARSPAGAHDGAVRREQGRAVDAHALPGRRTRAADPRQRALPWTDQRGRRACASRNRTSGCCAPAPCR